MRLQSLNRTNQDDTISTIGKFALCALGQVLYKKRFRKFLYRSFNNIDLSCDYLSYEENPLAIEKYKKSLLKLVLKNRGATFNELAIASGLTIIALYLSFEKAIGIARSN